MAWDDGYEMTTLCFYVYLVELQEAKKFILRLQNRHYVSQCPVSPLHGLATIFPSQGMRMAMHHGLTWLGEGFTCQVNRQNRNRTMLSVPPAACSANE